MYRGKSTLGFTPKLQERALLPRRDGLRGTDAERVRSCLLPAVVLCSNTDCRAREVERQNVVGTSPLTGHLGGTCLAKADTMSMPRTIEDESAVAKAEFITVAAHTVPAECTTDAEAQRGRIQWC